MLSLAEILCSINRCTFTTLIYIKFYYVYIAYQNYNACWRYFKLFPQDFLPSHLLSLTPLPPSMANACSKDLYPSFMYFIMPFVWQAWCVCVNTIHWLIYLHPTFSPLIPMPDCPLGPLGPSSPRSPCQTKAMSSALLTLTSPYPSTTIRPNSLHSWYCA